MNRLKETIAVLDSPANREVVRNVSVLLFCIIVCLLAACSRSDISDFGLDTPECLPDGEKIVVNFAINDISFGENIPVTRSLTHPADGFYYPPFQGAGNENSGESTLFVPIKDDIYMYASLRDKVEEAAIGLRANVAIAPNTRVRIVAYTG
jgi:hypothetical protein